jgi:uncharacterized protein (TIGR03086 family)
MSVTKSTVLPVSPDEAFALITEPERLRRWKTVTATVDLRVGGSYRFTVLPGNIAEGTYREIEPGRRIVFGWGWEGNPDLPKDASTVTITVEPVEGGSRVTLVHEGLTEDQAVAHAEGWNHFFERLERLAATGDAGQDEWAWAPEHLTPLVAAEAALAAIQPVLRNLTPGDQPKRTPCADFTAHELAQHLLGSLAQVGNMAGTRSPITVPQNGSLEDRVSVLTAQAVDAWRAVDLDGTVPGAGGQDVPAVFLASILPLELLLHGWDLAQASGQQLRVSDEVVAYVHELGRGVITQGRGSSFAEEVTPSADADADAVERFATYAGRTPIPT